MTAPWNVRATPRVYNRIAEPGLALAPKPDYWIAQVRIGGEWYHAGTGKTWLEAFLLGICA